MKNSDPEIRVTARHVQLTSAMSDYARKKIEGLPLDFPRVIDAHVILDINRYLHRCEVVLSCNRHIHIQAEHQSEDMYASIDRCVDKVARQMRKKKTKEKDHHRQVEQRTRKRALS
jgi:putative sigma-54 modulation protein